jgi:Contractile injection system tube protein
MTDNRLNRARFTDVTHQSSFDVHFNPVSLQLTLQNTLDEKGSGKSKTQYVSKSSSKLTMDLVFDTTATGGDVREHTKKVARFLEPSTTGKQAHQPPVVRFDWGTFGFQGLVEQYRETLDFFSPEGVPLRAGVNLTLASQEFVFSSQNAPASTNRQALEYTPPAASPVDRGLAAANGLESMRFPTGALVVDASIQLGAAVSFSASASAGLSLGGSAGLSLGGGASAGAGFSLGGGASAGAGLSLGGGVSGGAGLSFGASASAGPAFGGSASAGVSASAGAFAGLRSVAPRAGTPFDASRLLVRPATAVVATEGRATFRVGGGATLEGPASFSADVGASADGG